MIQTLCELILRLMNGDVVINSANIAVVNNTYNLISINTKIVPFAERRPIFDTEGNIQYYEPYYCGKDSDDCGMFGDLLMPQNASVLPSFIYLQQTQSPVNIDKKRVTGRNEFVSKYEFSLFAFLNNSAYNLDGCCPNLLQYLLDRLTCLRLLSNKHITAQEAENLVCGGLSPINIGEVSIKSYSTNPDEVWGQYNWQAAHQLFSQWAGAGQSVKIDFIATVSVPLNCLQPQVFGDGVAC